MKVLSLATLILIVSVLGVAQEYEGSLDQRNNQFNREQPRLSPALKGTPTSVVINSYGGLGSSNRKQVEGDAVQLVESLGFLPALNSRQLRARSRELDYQSSNKWVGNKPQEGQLLAAEAELHLDFTEVRGQTSWRGSLSRVLAGSRVSYDPKSVQMVGTATLFDKSGTAPIVRHAVVTVTEHDFKVSFRIDGKRVELGKSSSTKDMMRLKAARLLLKKLGSEFSG